MTLGRDWEWQPIIGWLANEKLNGRRAYAVSALYGRFSARSPETPSYALRKGMAAQRDAG